MRYIMIEDNFPEYKSPQSQALLFLNYVREKGAERNIKVPKRISHGGQYGNYWYISYTGNAFRDLVLECLKDKGFTVRSIVDDSRINQLEV